MDIETLYDICESSDKNVVVNINGEQKPLSAQYYVESDEVFLYVATGEFTNKNANASAIVSAIENEATDECWQPASLRDHNSYLDCDIYIVDGDDYEDPDTPIYEIDTSKPYSETPTEIILNCDRLSYHCQ